MVFTKESIINLVQNVPGGCIAYRYQDEKLHMFAFSEELWKTSGYSKEGLGGLLKQDPFEMIFEEDREQLKIQLRDCIRDNASLRCSCRIRLFSGKLIWGHICGRVLGELEEATAGGEREEAASSGDRVKAVAYENREASAAHEKSRPKILLATIQNISTAANRPDIVNQVVNGLGIYGIRDGMPYQIFLNDGYYEMLGVTRAERAEFLGERAIETVHPEDRKILLNGILEGMKGGGHIRIAIRILKKQPDLYCWVLLDGRRVEGGDVESFLVCFTNIDALKSTSNELEKSKMVLETSLAAGSQMCCEYDPVLHTLNGKTGRCVQFGLPNVVENFPQSLFHIGFFHPDDEEMVKRNMEKLDQGAEYMDFEARIRFKGNLRWFAFRFKRFFDKEKNYSVAICNFMDVTLQKEALQGYQNHLDTIMKMNPDSFATMRMNLTRNTCGSISSRYENIQKLSEAGTVTDFFDRAKDLIHSEEERREYVDTFRIPVMLDGFLRGQSTFSLQQRLELKAGSTEWIETVVTLMQNPFTGDVEGILYANNIHIKKIENLILRETLNKDYVKMAVLFTDQDEYYRFSSRHNEYGVCHHAFWKEPFPESAKQDTVEGQALRQKLSRETVFAALETQDQYAVTFQEDEPGVRRYQIQFTYISRQEHMILASMRDITDEALLEQLRYDSEHDALTGLYNREKTYAECDRLLAAHPEETFVMVHFDIQRFRLYNSFFGEAEGDNLLRYIADMFRRLSHTHDYGVYGRIEADVFCLCFPYRENVIPWNETFIHSWLGQYRKDFYVVGSCGVYLSEGNHRPAKVLFNWASIAAKNNPNRQTNRVSFFDEKSQEELHREHRILREMREALKEQQFVVYLQPKYQVNTEKPYGAEALVRWIHPEHGIVAPGDFIPIFERNGFITELDRYMWKAVCRLLRRWKREGRRLMPISVNVSRVSMYSQQTVTYLTELIQHYEIDPSLLNLELTESAYMDDPELMKERILELQKNGFQIMMDDFGSAYSSLNTLRELPVDFLKVDRKFLASIESDKRGQILLSAVVHMASALSIPVVMEGVETISERDFVAELGCDYIQGFYYSRPIPVKAYEQEVLEKSINTKDAGKE